METENGTENRNGNATSQMQQFLIACFASFQPRFQAFATPSISVLANCYWGRQRLGMKLLYYYSHGQIATSLVLRSSHTWTRLDCNIACHMSTSQSH